MIVVADTVPLAALLHLKQLPLLEALYVQIIIPYTVLEELKTLVSFGYDISFVNDTERLNVHKATDRSFIELLNKYLDAGKAEAIALAKESGADLLLIDEKMGKQYAEQEQIFCKDVIGVLIEAKLKG